MAIRSSAVERRQPEEKTSQFDPTSDETEGALTHHRAGQQSLRKRKALRQRGSASGANPAEVGQAARVVGNAVNGVAIARGATCADRHACACADRRVPVCAIGPERNRASGRGGARVGHSLRGVVVPPSLCRRHARSLSTEGVIDERPAVSGPLVSGCRLLGCGSVNLSIVRSRPGDGAGIGVQTSSVRPERSVRPVVDDQVAVTLHSEPVA